MGSLQGESDKIRDASSLCVVLTGMHKFTACKLYYGAPKISSLAFQCNWVGTSIFNDFGISEPDPLGQKCVVEIKLHLEGY